MRLSILLLTLFLPLAVLADTDTETNSPKLTVTELKWIDKNYLQRQVERIDDLARMELGSQVHGSISDLELLQRIINKGLIASDDREQLQALGAVLGNVMASEFNLVWQIYEDNIGRSRALCVKGTQHCLFPITMLSRRIEVGLIPNVRDIFDYCREEIRPYNVKNPYDAASHPLN